MASIDDAPAPAPCPCTDAKTHGERVEKIAQRVRARPQASKLRIRKKEPVMNVHRATPRDSADIHAVDITTLDGVVQLWRGSALLRVVIGVQLCG